MTRYLLKLKNHPSAQCKIEVFAHDDGSRIIEFTSYSTLVIVAKKESEDKGYMLQCTGTYSSTTARQISWFLHEYFPSVSYSNMKAIAGKGTWCGQAMCAKELPID